MRKRQVWRYSCDFCKKANCSAGAMTKHERGCTNNPNRVCGMCKLVEGEQKPIAELAAAARISLERLREVAGGCPACMLAGIRQAGPIDDVNELNNFITIMQDFCFKDECKSVWKEFNDREAENLPYTPGQLID